MMTVACDSNLKNSKNKEEKQIQFTIEDESEVKCWNFGGIEVNINEGITCSVNNNNNNNEIIMIILIVTLKISNQKPYNYNCQEYLKLDQKLKKKYKSLELE